LEEKRVYDEGKDLEVVAETWSCFLGSMALSSLMSGLSICMLVAAVKAAVRKRLGKRGMKSESFSIAGVMARVIQLENRKESLLKQRQAGWWWWWWWWLREFRVNNCN